MANINANEIERQAGRLDTQNVIFTKKVRDVINNLDNIAITVKSEDSSLSNEISKLSQNYAVLENKLSTNFKNLALIMHNYAKKSLSLDQTVTSEVKSTNTNLDNISSELNSVNSAPEIYVDFN